MYKPTVSAVIILLLFGCIQQPIELESVEVREYQGEDLSSIQGFRENSIKGPQYIDIEEYEIYEALSAYVAAFIVGLNNIGNEEMITNATIFRASMQLFKEVAQRVKDRHGPNYIVDNFYEMLEPMFQRVKVSRLKNPGKSYIDLSQHLSKTLKTDFTL